MHQFDSESVVEGKGFSRPFLFIRTMGLAYLDVLSWIMLSLMLISELNEMIEKLLQSSR